MPPRVPHVRVKVANIASVVFVRTRLQRRPRDENLRHSARIIVKIDFRKVRLAGRRLKRGPYIHATVRSRVGLDEGKLNGRLVNFAPYTLYVHPVAFRAAYSPPRS